MIKMHHQNSDEYDLLGALKAVFCKMDVCNAACTETIRALMKSLLQSLGLSLLKLKFWFGIIMIMFRVDFVLKLT